MNTLVCNVPEEVDAELERMGLSRQLIHDALKYAQPYVAECTEHDVRPAAGFNRYNKTLRHLRDRLVPQGWVSINDMLPSVDHPGRKISLTVGRGDEATGNPDPYAKPSTKYPRGMASMFAIANNGNLMFDLEFFREQRELATKLRELKKSRAAKELDTWWLLVHPVGDSVMCELSLPTGVGKNRKISDWKRRIIIGTIDLSTAMAFPSIPQFDSGPAIDVDIEARDA